MAVSDFWPPAALWEGVVDMGGGGEETADDMRNSSEFDYSWACGACDSPISDSDSSCGACGEPVEWNRPPIT